MINLAGIYYYVSLPVVALLVVGTHPSPAERFRLIERVTTRAVPAPAGEVWELFADRAKLTAEVSAEATAAIGGR